MIIMVYVFLADDFEEIEAIEPVDIMRRAGIEVKTVSVMNGLSVRGAHGITVEADMMLSDADPAIFDMIVLPGGMGHLHLDASNGVHALINEALIRGKYIAAICAAPSILGKKQLLSGKRATCFPGFEKYCYGADLTGEKCVVDGKIITGRGPGAAADFGFAIVAELKGAAPAAALKSDMQYND